MPSSTVPNDAISRNCSASPGAWEARGRSKSFAEFWTYRSESWVRRFFANWYRWATHPQLPEIISVTRTLKRHFANIIIYIRKPITNAAAERLNAKIHMIKFRARGYRNEGRFRQTSYSTPADLTLDPTHSKS